MGLILALLLLAQGWVETSKPLHSQVIQVISIADGDDSPGYCSGVVINTTGFLLTAAHCIPTGSHSLTVAGRHAEVARVNRLLDLAVVRFTPKNETAMPLAAASPAQGEEVAVVGFAFGDPDLLIQYGRVAQVLNAATKTLILNAQVLGGDSGGAIVNAKGQLVGLTVATWGGGRGTLGVAVPVEALVEFLESYTPKK